VFSRSRRSSRRSTTEPKGGKLVMPCLDCHSDSLAGIGLRSFDNIWNLEGPDLVALLWRVAEELSPCDEAFTILHPGGPTIAFEVFTDHFHKSVKTNVLLIIRIDLL